MYKARNIAAYIILCAIVVCTSLAIFPTQSYAGTIMVKSTLLQPPLPPVTTEAGPFTSFTDAWAFTPDGAVLYCEGLFTEDSINIPNWVTYLTIKASTETTVCTLEPAVVGNRAIAIGVPVPVSRVQLITMEGLIIKDYYISSGNGAGIFINTPLAGATSEITLILNKCVFYNNRTSSSIYMGGAVSDDKGSSHKIYANNCVFIRNLAGQNGAVAYGGNWTTKNCTFVSNEAGGNAAIWQGNQDWPERYLGSWIASNDVYEENRSPATGKDKLFNVGYVTGQPIKLNTCYIQPNAWFVDSTVIKNCISSEAKIGSTNIASPLFGKLMQHSSLIDAAIPPGFNDDILYHFRPHGWGYDVGAYEFQGPAIKLYQPTGPTLEAMLPISIETESTYRITWEAYDQYGLAATPITISFSSDEGASWHVIAGPMVDNRYWDWSPVTSYPSIRCLISVEAVNTSGEGNYDISSRNFSVLRPGAVYVSNSGDDSDTGTIDHPFKTIQKGLDSIAEGGTVYLYSGLYKGSKNRCLNWPPTTNITLKASTETSLCTIDAEGKGRIFASVGRITDTLNISNIHLTIEGITMQNGSTKEPASCMKLPAGANLWLKDVIVKNCSLEYTSFAYYGGAFYCDSTDNNMIFAENSLFSGIRAMTGFHGYGGVSYGCNWRAKNCIFVSNEAYNNGGVAYNSVTFEADNCVFVGNWSNNGRITSAVQRVAVRNSICWYNGSEWAMIFQSSSSVTTEYSDIEYFASQLFRGTGNITFEPGFISTIEPYNFRLKQHSHCIDSGTWEAGVLATDKDGNFRPHGFTADMGAYEFQGPSVSVLTPEGGEIFNPYDPIRITWNISDEYGLKTGPCITVEYSTNEGSCWLPIVTSSEADLIGNISWAVPTILARGKYYIRVTAINSSSEANYGLSGPFSVLIHDAYVTITGNDTNLGTIVSPFRTIQRGLDCVDESGSVYLGTGRYYGAGNRNLKWSNLDNVTLKASDETCICTIDAQSMYRIVTSFEVSAVTLEIEGITMKNGHTDEGAGYGGCILLPKGSTLFLKDVIVQNCSGDSSASVGGAFSSSITEMSDLQPTIYAENSKFYNNAARAGGVFGACKVNAKDCIFELNKGILYGGVSYYNYICYAENCTFISNEAGNHGGVTYSTGGTVEVVNCTFRGNHASLYGGVGSSDNNWRVTNSNFIGNYTNTYGGVSYGSNWKVVNSNFIGNHAAYGGVDGSSTWNAMNSIFADNYVDGYGGVGYAGSWTITNSILWGNYSTNPAINLQYPVFYSGARTIKYSDVQQVSPPYNLTLGVGCITTNPQFVSSTDFHPSASSPCIDSGTSEGAPSFDIEGKPRPLGYGFEMGAYEVNKPYVKVLSPNGNQFFNPGDPIDISWLITAEYGLSLTDPTPVKIRFVSSETGPWIMITQSSEVTGTLIWTAPSKLSGYYMISIEVTDSSGECTYDTSDAPFGIMSSVVYISASGNDTTGSGTIGSPFKSIKKGLSAVTEGGTVFMLLGSNGIYPATDAGNYAIVWPNRNYITLKASPETAVIVVNAMAYGRIISVESPGLELTIEGITLKAGKITGGHGGAIALNSDYAILHLRNMKILTCSTEASGNAGGGAVYSKFLPNPPGNSNKIYAVNSIFAGNKAGNGGVAYGGQWTAINCSFVDNKATGSGQDGRGGVALTGTWAGTNCIFWGNTGITYDANVMGATGTNPITSVNFDFTDVQPLGMQPFSANWVANNNISIEPRFVSSQEPYDLQLKYNSACINRGIGGFSRPDVPNYDINYNPRPAGSAYDMGAYEFYGFSVCVLSPNGGERFDPGMPMTITYNATDENGLRPSPPGPISIWFSAGTLEPWIEVTKETENTGTYDWTALPNISYTCRISVEAVNWVPSTLRDVSDNIFSVAPPITGVVTNEMTGRVYTTLQAALNESEPDFIPGVRGWLATGDALGCSGSFYESITWPNKPYLYIKLHGHGPTMSILQPTNARAINATNKANITIEGFLIQNGSATNQSGAGINLAAGSRLWLNDVWIRNCSASGAGAGAFGGAVYSLGSTVEANNSLFSNNKSDGGSGSTNGGGVFYGGSWKVKNSTFFDNESAYGSVAKAASLEARNSIFWGNTNPIFYSMVPGDPRIVYSDIQTTGFGWEPYFGLGNISFEPSFISPPVGINQDLRLQDNSPCIDTGTGEGATSLDMDGVPRPQGRGYDMGAYEQIAFASESPSIEAVYVNGVRFNSGDLISYNVTMTVLCSAKNGLQSMQVVIDGDAADQTWSFTGPNPGNQYWGWWTVQFNIPPQSDPVKSHTLTFALTDGAPTPHVAHPVLTATTMAGSVQIIGVPLNYPNPFKPLSANPDLNTTNIQYTLSMDAPVTVLIYDITGHEVKRIVSGAGANGGRAGINSVQWNGHSLFGETVGNGMYVYKIISGTKVIGSSKLVVFD